MNTGMAMSAVASLLVTLLVTVTRAAPVSSGIEGIKEALKSQIKDQEQALESLTRLTNTDTAKGMEVSKAKSFSYSNINGAENKVQQQEEKVSDPVANKVISDISEKLEQNKAIEDQQPKTSFQATVDIPDKGIHKQISTGDDEQTIQEFPVDQGTVAFTPEVVAEYLRGEGKVQEFQDLLNELVDSNEISPEEAEQYGKSVMDAFYNQEQQEENNADMAEVEPLYPTGFGDGPQPMFPMYNGAPFQPKKDDVYPYAYDQMPMVPGNPMADERMVEDYNPLSFSDMINYLLDEWLTRAVVTGDPEAAEILSNIIEHVSRDDDPNDEEQVKAILADIIAETLMEDLVSNIGPIPDTDVNIEQSPVQSALPSFPFPVPQQQQQQQQQQQPEISSDDTEDTSIDSAENETEDKVEQTPEETNKTEDLEAQLKM